MSFDRPNEIRARLPMHPNAPRFIPHEIAREILGINSDDGWIKLKDLKPVTLPANGPQEQIREQTDGSATVN